MHEGSVLSSYKVYGMIKIMTIDSNDPINPIIHDRLGVIKLSLACFLFLGCTISPIMRPISSGRDRITFPSKVSLLFFSNRLHNHVCHFAKVQDVQLLSSVGTWKRC